MAKLVLVAGSVFGDLTRDAIRLVGALLGAVMAVVILVVVAVAMIIAAPFVGLGGGGSEPPVLPAEHLAVMVDVSNESGVPWALLAAIASVESGFGQNMATSWAGAIGYGQFMPPSWAAFG
ncbi:MAG: transglycosylase SLT domain-containing protein, partial [Dehalococcoidia bacterium]